MFLLLFSYIKWSSLVIIRKPDINVRFFKSGVLGCPVPAKMDHSGTGQVRYSDGDLNLDLYILFIFVVLYVQPSALSSHPQ
jgi:hypothetical protein